MKSLFLLFVAQVFMMPLQAQTFALGNDVMNVAYLGIDNPISVAVENCLCKDIVLKVKNGTVDGRNCRYVFRGKEAGVANIVVYKKDGKQLKVIGEYPLRVKRIPKPVFKIGPYGNDYESDSTKKIERVILAAQQFVRADIECCGFDARATVKSFSVKIFYADSAKSNIFFNETGKINEQISKAFSELKKDDVIFFYKVIAIGPDGLPWQLDPLILTIDK
jgi:GldM C-terminal domain